MTRRISTVLVLSLLVFAFVAMPAFAAKAPVSKHRVVGPQVDRAMQYSFPEEPRFTESAGQIVDRPSLGAPASSFYDESTGKTIGSTWYDYQHNGTMGRMVDWGYDATNGLIIHFNWMKLPSVNTHRHYRYNAWIPDVGEFSADGGIDPTESDPDFYSGYVGIDVTPDNRAVLGGHANPGTGTYQAQFYWDGDPGLGFFHYECRVPDNVASQGGINGATEAIWPKFRFQIGTDTVLHVFAQMAEDATASPQSIIYFRRVGYADYVNGGGCTGASWDQTAYVVDTVFDIGQDIDASKTSDKVVLAWMANIPIEGANPWESNNDGGSQWDNDIFYEISGDQGAHWGNTTNVTMSVDGEDGFRPFTDLSVLMDHEDVVHIAWTGRYWPGDVNASLYWDCRVFHWSEALGFEGSGTPNVDPGVIRTVYDANWTIGPGPDQHQCTGGGWQLNAAKLTISECGDPSITDPEDPNYPRLYCIWTQFGDPKNGVVDDCADRAEGSTGDWDGSANGEIMVSVSSSLLGLLWDEKRNLTQSYSGGCDPEGAGGPCESDHWASMARFGTDLTGTSWPTQDAGGNIHVDVTPSPGSFAGSYYLDVMFVNDLDAGGIVQTEGTWQDNPVKWFRMACVTPVPNPSFASSWSKIAYPAWAKHGVQLDTALTIENSGNVALNYGTPAVNEINGPAGWLTISGFTGTVPSGLSNTETGTVHLNTGGTVNSPGTEVELQGELTFTHNGSTSPDVLPISFWVADTVVQPTFDTIFTDYLALVVGSNGNFGHAGEGKSNLDYVYSDLDCDSTADVVVYDGSPIIGWISGDTVMNWSIFGDSYTADEGYRPVSHIPTSTTADYDVFSAVFTTADTSVTLEKIWYAPKNADSSNFVIECLKIYATGDAVNGVVVGEAIDFDLMADSGSDNGSGFDASRMAIYQYGGEYNQDDSTECQENDLRYGGMAFLDSRTNFDCPNISEPYGAYTASNGDYVYPTGSFVAGELYSAMINGEGYSTYFNANPDSAFVDLHTVMTFETGLDLAPGVVYTYYVAIASTKDGGEAELQSAFDKAAQWYADHLSAGYNPEDCSCCEVRGDMQKSGSIDVSDLTYLVDYLFGGGAAPICDIEGDINASGSIDVSDLTFLVDYLFGGGAPPPPC